MGEDKKPKTIGDENATKKALIIYNPDPLYNLDEQVCKSFAEGLGKHGFSSKVATVRLAPQESETYDLYVFCANTYNWAPDWLVTKYIKGHANRKGKA